MPDPKHVELLKKGTEVWNSWREQNSGVRPQLSDINFETDIHEYDHLYDTPIFSNLDLSGADLNRIQARNSRFKNCIFDRADINFADVCFSNFIECTFQGTCMRVTKIGSASFVDCEFHETDLSYCSAEETNFSGSEIKNSRLCNMSMVKTNLSDTEIYSTRVYGLSAWDLGTDGSRQQNILISEEGNTITVDDIEIAQFIHLLLRTPKIRSAIDTITSKVVLILGRFSDEQKRVLDVIKRRLRALDYVPVVFDFEVPSSRDMTETISILASLARFVVADLTNPRSVPHELASTVRDLPSVPVQPIISEGERPYGMFEHLKSYPWILEGIKYQEDQVVDVANRIAQRCEEYLDSPSSNE